MNADFDLAKKESEGVKGTVLDVVEQILAGSQHDEDKQRFIKTKNILVKNGAMKYASLKPEL